MTIEILHLRVYNKDTIKQTEHTKGKQKMTVAVVDYKAGKGYYKKYIVDRNEYPDIADIVDALMHEDVYKVEVYEGDKLVHSGRNYR